MELITALAFLTNYNCYFWNPRTRYFSKIIALAFQQLKETLHKEFIQNNSHLTIIIFAIAAAILLDFFTSFRNFGFANYKIENLSFEKYNVTCWRRFKSVISFVDPILIFLTHDHNEMLSVVLKKLEECLRPVLQKLKLFSNPI